MRKRSAAAISRSALPAGESRRIVKEAGLRIHVRHRALLLPNFVGLLAPQKRETEPWVGRFLSIPVRSIHAGDITEIGSIVAGAFAPGSGWW
jgi:hypothetical protein